MNGLTVGSLCSGYEATSLGLALAGWDHRLAFVADPDPAASKVLAHHHPDVPNLGDITRVDWSRLERVDLLTAGFPCTDISCAGRQAGLGAGTRSGVWANVADAIDVLRPRLVLIENVAALLSTPANRSTDGADSDMEPGPAGMGDTPDRPALRALGAVLGDLADLRFDAVWVCVSAAEVGAPHLRKRVFILAWDTEAEDRVREILDWISGPVRGDAVRPDGLTLLPTPRTSDTQGVGEHGTGGLDLRTAVSLLPTPRARDVKGAETEATRASRIERGTAHAGHDLPTTLSLLPTPAARLGDGRGTPNPETAARRMGEEGRRNLDDAVALLPTPTARDGDGRGEGSPDYWQRRREELGRDNGIPLGAAVTLLPTPTATPYGNNQSPSAGAAVHPSLDGLVRDADRWGEYAPAIARWEAVIGRPAPDPTEPGTKGQPRLSPRFVEWLQGLDDGYVTAVPGISRNDALRLLGNANPPQQYAAAVTRLAAIVAGLFASEVAA